MTDLRTRSDAYLTRTIARCEWVMDARGMDWDYLHDRKKHVYRDAYYRRLECQQEQRRRRSDAITLHLPLPRELLPNNRSGAHWAPHAKIVKRWRYDAGWLLWCHRSHNDPPWPALRMDIEWRHCGKLPDPENCRIAMKAIIDGIADTGIVADDKYITTGTVSVVRVKRADEGLVLTLTRTEDA